MQSDFFWKLNVFCILSISLSQHGDMIWWRCVLFTALKMGLIVRRNLESKFQWLIYGLRWYFEVIKAASMRWKITVKYIWIDRLYIRNENWRFQGSKMKSPKANLVILNPDERNCISYARCISCQSIHFMTTNERSVMRRREYIVLWNSRTIKIID